MPDHSSAQSSATWPMPKIGFRMNFGSGQKVIFQELSGLDTETQAVEHHHGLSSAFSPIKMPGISKVGNVTLKRGVFANDNTF